MTVRQHFLDLPHTHRWPSDGAPGNWYVRLDDVLAYVERLARIEAATRSTLDAMAMDPCDCMAHRSPPELLRAALVESIDD